MCIIVNSVCKMNKTQVSQQTCKTRKPIICVFVLAVENNSINTLAVAVTIPVAM